MTTTRTPSDRAWRWIERTCWAVMILLFLLTIPLVATGYGR